METDAKKIDGGKSKWYDSASKWFRIVAIVFGLLLLGFATSFLISSQTLVGSVQKRNFHVVDVAAHGLETWPDSIRQVARSRYVDPNTLYDKDNPELGKIRIDYKSACPKPEETTGVVFVPGVKPGQGTMFTIDGSFVPKAKAPVCYTASVELARLVNIARSAPDFTNLLIVAGDGRVIEQLGQSPLPIDHVPEFTLTGSLAKDMVGQFVPGKSATTTQHLPIEAVQSVVAVEIAGESYQAYVKPFRIDGPRDACRPDGDAHQAGKNYRQCYAVGLMPNATLWRAWLAPRPLSVILFGLALLILVAFIPLVRLLLIGGGESASPIEVFGVVVGIQAATALATLLILFVGDMMLERKAIEAESGRVATRLARQAEGEIGAALVNVIRFSNSSHTASAGCKTVGTMRDCSKALHNPVLPQLESIHYINDGGETMALPLPVRFHDNAPPKIDAGYRGYFRSLQRGETNERRFPTNMNVKWWEQAAKERFPRCQPWGKPEAQSIPMRYTIGQVLAQTDGSNKTVIAVACTPPNAVGKPHYLLAATPIRSFLAPLLPYPDKFLVVDTARPGLPVVFHQERDRAGTEHFADQADVDPEVFEALSGFRRSATGAGSQPIFFATHYDGAETHFAAMPVAGTDWVVLVYHPLDVVDGVAARTVARAVLSWGSFAIIAMLIAVWRLFRRRGQWRNLWPDQDGAAKYAKLLPLSILIAIVAGVGGGIFAPLFGVATAIIGWAYIAHRVATYLEGVNTSDDALTPATERIYRNMVLALLIGVAVVPMFAFWRDARTLSHEMLDNQRALAAEASLDERFTRTADVRRSFDMDAKKRADMLSPPGIPELQPHSARSVTPLPPPTLSGFMSSVQVDLPSPQAPRCKVKAGSDAWMCLEPASAESRQGLISMPDRSVPFGGSMPGWIGIAILGAMLMGMIYGAVHFALEALTGFGIPLGASHWERLKLGSASNLATRTLLVAPHQAVRDQLDTMCPRWSVDLADTLLASLDSQLGDGSIKARFETALADKLAVKDLPRKDKPSLRLIVSGLGLLLRDPLRRRAALKFLEAADRAVDAKHLSGIVIISDMSPLERILDAFDSEKYGNGNETADSGRRATREDLRWSRLFEKFTTFSFSPLAKIDMGDDRVKQLVKLPERDFEKKAALALIEEFRWLPGNVVESVIGDTGVTAVIAKEAKDAEYVFPLGDNVYKEHYTQRVIDWAKANKPPSRAAAIDFMRSNLIEHYEQCWVSSTHTERLVLDAIARGHFVNMRHAIVAIQSLVRRGLVILDPTPRLTNRSFELFVRQAERPDTLAKWREKLPRSSWAAARWPLLLAIPAGMIGLTVAAGQSGQSLTAIFTLLATGAPALVGVLVKSIRPAA